METNQQKFCPACKEALSYGKLREYETLCDHVCDPNRESYPLRPTLVCTNPSCKASKEDVFWDEDGDFYGIPHEIGIPFNESCSCFPSISRKSDIEIYRKGLKHQIYLHPIFGLFLLRPYIDFSYKADLWGNVLSKSWKIKWLKRDGERDYCVHYISGLSMIFYGIKKLNEMISDYNKRNSEYLKKLIEEEFSDLPKWDKRWWRKAEKWIYRFLFLRKFKKIKERYASS